MMISKFNVNIQFPMALMTKTMSILSALKCCRMKATAMIKEMAAQTSTALVNRMRSGPYSLSTDGSNDAESKQYPLVIRTVAESGLVTSEVLSVPVCKGSSSGKCLSLIY